MNWQKFFKLWLPVVFWCGVIFTLSSIPSFPRVGFIWWDFVLKKTAHVSEYAILFFLIYRARSDNFTLNISKRQVNLIALLCFFYAISDEYHQSFVLGRTSTIRDVGFDSVGIFLSSITIKKKKQKLKEWLKNI